MSLETPKTISLEEEDVDDTEEEEFFEEFNPNLKLSQILFELQELVHKEQIEQITGEMYNGQGGFCISGGIAWRKGIDKIYIKEAPAIQGIDERYVFGEHRITRCPECDEPYANFDGEITGVSVQNFLIHLNDDHNITFGQAGEILEGMGL